MRRISLAAAPAAAAAAAVSSILCESLREPTTPASKAVAVVAAVEIAMLLVDSFFFDFDCSAEYRV